MCFNPPYSANIVTNFGKHFLSLLAKHFPPYNKFHRIFNKNTVKISYNCMPNMKTIIHSENLKISYPKIIIKENNCNCVDKAKCLLGQNCFINNIIYKAVLTSTNPYYKEKVYFGKLKLYSSNNTQVTKGNLSFQSTKQALNYPTKYGE